MSEATEKPEGVPDAGESTEDLEAVDATPDVAAEGNPAEPQPEAPHRPAGLRREEARRAANDKERHDAREAWLAVAEEDDKVAARAKWAREDAQLFRPGPEYEEVEVYPVAEPHAYVQILRHVDTRELVYHVVEPDLTSREEDILRFIEATLVDALDVAPKELGQLENMHEYIEAKVDEVIEDYAVQVAPVIVRGRRGRNRQEQKEIGEEDTVEAVRRRLMYHVKRDFIGEGPIDILMKDAAIEDVSCDGCHQPVFIYHRFYEAMTTTVRFPDDAELDSFVVRLAQRAGKHVSLAEPILDATLTDGSRLQATLAREVSAFGSTFTIRKFRDVPFSPGDLVRFGTVDASVLAYLWMVVEHGLSAIMAGGTASGKTTAINALMMFIPYHMKVVSIEDTRELNVPQPNWIAGVTRSGFGPRDASGRQPGEIDMFQLLRNALRQRPEYIIVGEVRGAEAYNLFQAMATGHAAYGTLHADSVEAVIHRLESEPMKIPRALLEALDVVCVQGQTRLGGKRVRRMRSITEIVGLDTNTRELLTNEIFRWDPETDTFRYSGNSYALQRIAEERGVEPADIRSEMAQREALIETIVEKGLYGYEDMAWLIRQYALDADATIASVLAHGGGEEE